METLREKIEADIKSAMINKETEKKDVLKFIKSEIMRSEKDSNSVMEDADVIKAIRKAIKNLETINSDESRNEISILSEYLPKALSKEEIGKMTREAILKYPEKYAMYKEGNKGMIGLFVGEVMKMSKGSLDPKEANKVISEILNEA